LLDELSTYVMPGRVNDPRQAPSQAAEIERVGLGTAWLSERWGQKDSSVLCGAMAQVTRRVKLGVGVLHPHTRHPSLLAGFGSTMQSLSGGRFIMGIGRGAPGTWEPVGLPMPTTEMLRDLALILQGLWRGETVSYRGPLGRFPALRLTNPDLVASTPLFIAASGPETLRMAGEVYDGVITRTFLTVDAFRRSAQIVRNAAAATGRDPASVRMVHCLVCAPNLSPERTAAVVGGRLITYLQYPGGNGAMLPEYNGWDPAVIDRVRSHPLFAQLHEGQTADGTFTLEDLARVASETVPPEWIDDGAAVGAVHHIAQRVRQYLSAGADEVLLHGPAPSELAGVVSEMREQHSPANTDS
jgi:probable F420-dependent oxidoreductase